MAAASVHEDILALAKTRLAALNFGTTPDDLQSRVVEIELFFKGFAAGLPPYPLLMISGSGLRRNLGQTTQCNVDREYPLLIRLLDRVQKWSTERRDLHLKWVEQIIRAFDTKLVLTYSGASCMEMVLQDTMTIEEDENKTYEIISRPILYSVRVRQTKA